MSQLINRRKTKRIEFSNTVIGGNAPITVQSMTNTRTSDIDATVLQIHKLQDAGCDIIRVAVPDMESAQAISKIKSKIKLPLVADIHFDHRLAIESIKNGADKIRINPGNIGSIEKVKQVVDLAKERNIPIRIGVNAGSLHKDILAKYGHITPEALVESAMTHIDILEGLSFDNIILSIKASNVLINIAAYRLISSKVDYPLHLGVTEAGTPKAGIIKSSIGIGILLHEGIGDTLRVSLTGDPTLEVTCGKQILKSLGIINEGPDLISCPTCGRTRINLIQMAEEVEIRLAKINKNIKVAVMGCAVNGPGEAREADIGIAGGDGEVILFKKGEIVRKIPENLAVDELFKEIDLLEV